MRLHVPNRRAVSTLAAVLMVVVVIAAFSLLVVAALFIMPSVPIRVPGTGSEVLGSGRVVTKELQFSDFRAVRIGSAFQARITYSSSYAVSVTMDENLFDYLEATKQGDVLAIGLKSGYEYHYQSLTLKAEVKSPDLYELQLGGAARCSIQGFSLSHKFTLVLSGASSTEIADTSSGSLETDISGASRLTGSITVNGEARFTVSGASTVTLGGRANNLLTVSSGASRAELSDFTVHDARVNLSGASQATINLDGRLDADLSGASRLLYIGAPTMGDITVTGGSTIEKK